MIWIPARKWEILYCKTGSFIVEVPEGKIKHTIPKQKESYNRYCVFFRYQSMQEKLPVAGSVGDLRSQKTPRGILPVNSNKKQTALTFL